MLYDPSMTGHSLDLKGTVMLSGLRSRKPWRQEEEFGVQMVM